MQTSRKVFDSVEKRKLSMSNKFHTSRITLQNFIFFMVQNCMNFNKFFRSWKTLVYRTSIQLFTFYICFVQLKLIIVNCRVAGSNGTNESIDCPRSPRALRCECHCQSMKARDAMKEAHLTLFAKNLRELIVSGYQLLI